ncbi:ATP-binding protein [Cyanobium sp. A1C-AMD]|uniref:ATP-binding protein n=1 Tax=Cyanobium sp. A1C-AMD TaxID=2823694 RepID=UPI0020CB9BAB|nr:ATP-binding protein [Cyanobium sp. A1C-AMD]MCP9878440.1 ATP-binding protein [Cyanobium sp. A1C-AMD]
MALRWSDFITPSTLQLAPLLELLIEPIRCLQLQGQVQLGLQEALVNAVRHGNGCDPAKSLRVRRIETPNWLVWQVQDEGAGVPPAARSTSLPEQLDAAGGRGLFLIHHCFDDVRWSNRGNRLQLAVSRQRASLLVPVGGWGNQDRSTQP